MKKLILIIFLFLSLSLRSQSDLPEKLSLFINEWLGVPYKFGGSTKKGIDCSKFTQKLFKDVYGVDIPGVSWKQWNFTERISFSDLMLGDLVFFNSRKSPSGWHVGFYSGENKFVHASNRKDDVKISSLQEEIYRKNFKGGGRLPNLPQIESF